MKLKNDQFLFIYSMGKRLRVTAIFHSDNDANAYLEKNRDEGVIASYGPYVLVASLYDRGCEAEYYDADNGLVPPSNV